VNFHFNLERRRLNDLTLAGRLTCTPILVSLSLFLASCANNVAQRASTGSDPSSERPIAAWLAPLDPTPRPFNGTQGSADYFELFIEGNSWPKAEAQIKVFKIYQQLIARGSEDSLRALFNYLRVHHVSLAIEFGAMTDTDNCGRGVEGFDGEALPNIARRIQSLGGNLVYLAMDEPLWYGKYYNGKNACHSSIDAISADVAKNIKSVRVVSPGIIVGDIEPVPQAQVPDWSSEILKWLTAYKAATGENLAFFHADVIWQQPWQPFVSSLAPNLRNAGIKLGVIINGTGDEAADQTWFTNTMEHCRQVKERFPQLDELIFQSWTTFPTRVLPESAPATMTNLVTQCLGAS
jgi:hypothetical protein